MKKTELIEALAKREDLGLTQKKSRDIINGLIEEIQKGLIEDKEVQITGFGTWKSKHVAEREGRNPKKPDETMIIPARNQISFSAGAQLKNAVNGVKEEKTAKKRIIKK